MGKVVRITAFILMATASAAALAQAKNSKIDPIPKDLEMEVALSALPPHLRDQATVYTFNAEKGFEVSRRGSNGFHAIVARIGDDTFRGDWPLKEYRDDVLYPIAFDAAGAKAQMRVFFDAADLYAKGKSAPDMKKEIQSRIKKGKYKKPERFGLTYMLSPVFRSYLNPDKDESSLTMNHPHVMYLAPSIKNEDIGGVPPDPSSPYPFTILNGPHGYVVQMLGKTEKAAITKEYAAMIDRLCKFKSAWCLPPGQESHAHK